MINRAIFVTSAKEWQKFENSLLKIATTKISNFKGRLMSWDSDKKEPLINTDFIKTLSPEQKIGLQELIDSLYWYKSLIRKSCNIFGNIGTSVTLPFSSNWNLNEPNLSSSGTVNRLTISLSRIWIFASVIIKN